MKKAAYSQAGAAWQTVRLAEAAFVGAGNSAPQKKELFKNGCYPFIRTSDVGQIGFGDIHGARDLLNEAGVAKLRRVPKGAILMPKSGASTFLNHRVEIKVDAYVSSHLATIEARPGKVLPRYLLYYLSTVQAQDLIQDHKYPSLTLDIIGNILVPLPPIEEQKRIVEILDQVFAAVDHASVHAESNVADVEELFDSFLATTFAPRENWECLNLGERVKFIDYRGKTPPKTDTGVPLITAKNVRMGYIKREPREFIPEHAYDAWMTRGFPELGDVLFTTEAPLANVAELDTDEKVVIGQRLITFKTNPREIAPRFLKWSLISPQMQEEIYSFATGATVLGIKAKLLKKVRLYVPTDISKQNSIAAACEEAFDRRNNLIDLYNDKLAELDELRQSVLQKAFAGELN